MGEAKKRKQRFLAANPACCFCGGKEAATTIDHIPARICFPEKVPPEGFEFPACARCQNASRLDELAFGNFVRLSDPSPENYRREDILRCVEGLRNNLPHLVPTAGLSRIDKRRALRSMGLGKPPNVALDRMSMVAFPKEIDAYVHRYARKMAAAIYYKEKGKAVGSDFLLWTNWIFPTYQQPMQAVMEVLKDTPFRTIASRPNLNFGNRFGYRFGKANDNDLLMIVSQFGNGVIVTMQIMDDVSARELGDNDEEWVKVSAMFD